MSKDIKNKIYELLYSWEVSEHCDYCQHMTTYRDNDNRHPCAQCNSFNRFKIAEHIEKDIKDKVKQIMNIKEGKTIDIRKEIIEKACNWMRQQTYQEFAGAPFERLISDDLIDEFVKSMEE